MDRKKTFVDFMPPLYGDSVPSSVAWLDEQGFFTLPAFINHHGEPGHEVFGGAVVGRTYAFDYKPTDDQIYTGHGDKSVLMLAPWVNLTAEEVACIRWHMGAFDEKDQWKHYTAAIHDFPNVLWTHHADMIAAHIKGV